MNITLSHDLPSVPWLDPARLPPPGGQPVRLRIPGGMLAYRLDPDDGSLELAFLQESPELEDEAGLKKRPGFKGGMKWSRALPLTENPPSAFNGGVYVILNRGKTVSVGKARDFSARRRHYMEYARKLGFGSQARSDIRVRFGQVYRQQRNKKGRLVRVNTTGDKTLNLVEHALKRKVVKTYRTSKDFRDQLPRAPIMPMGDIQIRDALPPGLRNTRKVLRDKSGKRIRRLDRDVSATKGRAYEYEGIQGVEV